MADADGLSQYQETGHVPALQHPRFGMAAHRVPIAREDGPSLPGSPFENVRIGRLRQADFLHADHVDAWDILPQPLDDGPWNVLITQQGEHGQRPSVPGGSP
jgi:hypothetical protein